MFPGCLPTTLEVSWGLLHLGGSITVPSDDYTQCSAHVCRRDCWATGHQAVTMGDRRGLRSVSFRLATSFPLGPDFLHGDRLGLSSSGHVGPAHVVGDKEVFPYDQKAFIVGRVALPEAAYSRPSLYTRDPTRVRLLSETGPTKRHM